MGMTKTSMPAWKRALLYLQSTVGGTWHDERPLRMALDIGSISHDEYDRRRWEHDYDVREAYMARMREIRARNTR